MRPYQKSFNSRLNLIYVIYMYYVVNKLKLRHFKVTTTIVDGVVMKCIKYDGVQLHRKEKNKSRSPEPPKFDALIQCPR